MKGLRPPMAWVLAGGSPLLALTPGPPEPQPVGSRPPVELRQQYNEVTAAIDTLVRLYSAQRLARLADPSPSRPPLPDGSRLVLLFWADDEAGVYLNGWPVGQTRLTPTRVEIPSIYLESANELTAHAWDTDRVECGFMAGLYVEDGDGLLHPVSTTSEGHGWKEVGGGQIQEIFYSHTQPDLPGAQVVWGPQLFGEVRLSVRFSAAEVSSAATGSPLQGAAAPTAREVTMDLHQVIGRLVGLQSRRRELASRLEGRAEKLDGQLRWRGGTLAPTGGAYTLGSARPLEESVDQEALSRISEWSRRLPAQQLQQVLREARRWRGPQDATPPMPPLETAAALSAQDRRTDYSPPADRRTAGEGAMGAGAERGRGQAALALVPSATLPVRLGLMALACSTWAVAAAWRWWRLLVTVTWKSTDR